MKYSSPRVPLSRKWPPPPRGEKPGGGREVWACLGLAHHACRRAGLFRACSALTSRPSVHRGQMSHEDLECRRPVGVGEAARTVVRIASWKPGLDSQLGLGQRQGDRGVAGSTHVFRLPPGKPGCPAWSQWDPSTSTAPSLSTSSCHQPPPGPGKAVCKSCRKESLRGLARTDIQTSCF